MRYGSRRSGDRCDRRWRCGRKGGGGDRRRCGGSDTRQARRRWGRDRQRRRWCRFDSRRLCCRPRRGQWRALHRADWRLGRCRHRLRAVGRRTGRCRGRWCLRRCHRRTRLPGSRRRRRRHGSASEQARGRTGQRRIRNRRRGRDMLRVGAVGDQCIGDIGERGAVRLLGFRRHAGQVGIGLVGTGRRWPLLGNLAALQIVPPSHWVYRCGERRASSEQQRQQRRVAAMQDRGAGFEAATSLNPPPRTPTLPASSAAQHRRIHSRTCVDVACGSADGKDGYG